ncbi:MAG: hypothetical protein B1H03_02945 [Planctomycetales bacterium 4484_113]|nr:MAG: hypothetical protein B1H03_02945 [Planctomycetales bacterium 4484_113]
MSSQRRIVIIGGGIVGFGVAANLLKMGERDLVLLEREKLPGQHSTGKSAGGFRAQFSTQINIELMMQSIEILTHFSEEFGADAEVRQYGYLFMATTRQQMEALRQNVELQRKYGLEVEFLEGSERILEICPQINTEDIVGGTFCPTDGYFDPYEFMQGYANFAEERGLKTVYEAEVTGFEIKDGTVLAVQTKAGDFPVDIVVLAAGAWSGEVGKLAGVDIPVVPVRRQLFDTEPFDGISQQVPLMADLSNGFYIKSESGGFLLGCANKDEPPGFNTSVDLEYKFKVVEMALHRFPVLADATVREGWAGLYSVSPDHHAIVGVVPPLANFFVISGFSGHGAMQSPGATRCLAELIVEGSSRSVDISPLSITRFRPGPSPLMETTVI